MAYPWFKFFGNDYLADEKMLGMDGNIRSCWLTLLCYASRNDGIARYITEEQLMIQAGVPVGGDEWNRTLGVLGRFKARNMVSITENGIEIVNWEKRQAMYQTGAERMSHLRHKRDTKVTLEEEEEVDVEEEVEEELFTRVWEVYPKKQGKAPALKAFDKLKADRELTDRIVSAIALAKTTSQWKDNEGRYIPLCATYLNQRRFEDELPAPKPVVVGYELTERGMRPVLDPEIQALAAKMSVKEL